MSEVLERRLTSLEKDVGTQGKRIDVMEGEIKEIVKLLSARPTWFITILLIILSTVTSSLIVYVVTHH